MTDLGLSPERTTIRTGKKLRQHVILPLFFFVFLLFIPMKGFSQPTSTDRLTHTVYKFSIPDVTNPEQAIPVQLLLMNQAYASSCTFIDECDCFKMSVRTPVEYDIIEEDLESDGYVLSEEIFVSDGRILKSEATPIQVK